MRLIVSVNTYKHEGYTCVSSLKNIDWSTVDCLIFNSARDGEVETLLELSKVSDSVKKVIYISQVINALYYGLFTGMDADIYSDEEMLQDKDMLDELVDSYKETGMTIKSPDEDVEKISKFLATISKENADTLAKMMSNGLFLRTLETSVNNVETALVRTNEANTSMVDMFNKTAEIITDLEAGHEKISGDIEKLRECLQDVESRNTKNAQLTQVPALSTPKSTTFYFPTYNVPNVVSNVLYIKCYSPCKYLVSFIMAYQHYLKMTKKITCKTLLVAPNFKQIVKKYDEFPRLTVETIHTLQYNEASGDFFFTYEPKQGVLDAFFNMKSSNTSTVYIVIDMMYGDNLLAGAKVRPLNAINGLSDMKKFGLTASKCITSIIGTHANIIIPHLPSYNSNGVTPAKRLGYYFEACRESGTSKSYAKLDKLFGLS